MKLTLKPIAIRRNNTEQFYFIGEYYPSTMHHVFYAYTFQEEAYLKLNIYKQLTKKIG